MNDSPVQQKASLDPKYTTLDLLDMMMFVFPISHMSTKQKLELVRC